MVVYLGESYGYEPIAPEAVISTQTAAQSLSATQYSGLTQTQQAQVQAIEIFTQQGYPSETIRQIMEGEIDPAATYPVAPSTDPSGLWAETVAAWQKGWGDVWAKLKYEVPVEEGGITPPTAIMESWQQSFQDLWGGFQEVISHIPLIPDVHYDPETGIVTPAAVEDGLSFWEKGAIGVGAIVLGLGALFILTRKK